MSEESQNTKLPSREASYEAQSPVGLLTRPRPSPLIETPPPPTDASSIVPAGMDAASYAAGERSAYARAFSAALPSQQALGQLFQAVDTLHERLENDAAAVRALQDERIHTTATIDSMSHRIESITARCDQIAARPALSPEVASALEALRTTLSEISLSCQQGQRGRGGFIIQQLYTLVATLNTYALGLISKADVAAIFLSRKILVGDMAQVVVRGSGSTIRNKAKVAAGAALFVGLVEGAWQIQEKTARQLPRVLRSANAPLRTGLKVARTAVWTAAFVLAANELRNASLKLFSPTFPNNNNNNNIDICSNGSSSSATTSPPYSPSLAGTLADLESGRTPPRRPASAGSPAPAKNLLRDNVIYEKKQTKELDNDDDDHL